MACETWKTKFDTYIDGELPANEMRTFDAHVRTCASCAADALSRVQMKRSIHNAGKRFSATPEFRKKILQSIETKPSRSSIGFGWIPIVRAATVAATLLVVIGLAVIYKGREHARAEQVYSEAVDLHVAMLASASPVDVVSSDRHTVKPWFQGKIPFTFDLPELQNSAFSLLGGRVTYLDQSVGAHLIYEVRKHRISVFIFQEQSLRGKLEPRIPAGKELSFNMETWAQGGLRYIVIGDAGAADIDALSKLFNHQTT
ncbi:MAG TPA: zf-HC2 domain-containing protein [Terriglobales bacterium]|nr:zf-HC2 domain-containing protein [Terriglobales bacterium]